MLKLHYLAGSQLHKGLETTTAPTKPVLRTALLYGGITGLLCIAWVVGLYLSGNNPYGPKRLMAIFFPPLAVLIGQWRVRRYFGPDGPGLLKSIGTGLLITLFTAVISAGGVYVLARTAGPVAIEKHLVEMRHLLEQTKSEFLKQANGEQQYEQAKRNLARTPQDFAADDYKNKLLFGFLMSIPGGIFLRK